MPCSASLSFTLRWSDALFFLSTIFWTWSPIFLFAKAARIRRTIAGKPTTPSSSKMPVDASMMVNMPKFTNWRNVVT